MIEKVIGITHKRLAKEVNKYIHNGTVTPIREDATGKPCLIIQIDGFKQKAIIPVDTYINELSLGEKSYALILPDVLKTVDKTASKIPELKEDTYFDSKLYQSK